MGKAQEYLGHYDLYYVTEEEAVKVLIRWHNFSKNRDFDIFQKDMNHKKYIETLPKWKKFLITLIRVKL